MQILETDLESVFVRLMNEEKEESSERELSWEKTPLGKEVRLLSWR